MSKINYKKLQQNKLNYQNNEQIETSLTHNSGKHNTHTTQHNMPHNTTQHHTTTRHTTPQTHHATPRHTMPHHATQHTTTTPHNACSHSPPCQMSVNQPCETCPVFQVFFMDQLSKTPRKGQYKFSES